jgi:hypothetical protein
MPPVVAAAAIGGAAAIGSGILASGANKNAAKAQTAANDKALAYQREQDALVEKHRLEDRQLQQQSWDAEQARKAPARAAAASIWRRLGINVPDQAASVMPPSWTGGGTTAAAPATAAPTVASLFGAGAVNQATAPQDQAAAAIGAPTAAMTLEQFLNSKRRRFADPNDAGSDSEYA